jgi:ubiquinone/menaquinone biosynthesis C-methylase UbiE
VPANAFQKQIFLASQLSLSQEELLELATVSALPWSKGRGLLQFPENVNGLSILDVGGGGSDITASLVELGADAFALDPRYRKKSEIEEAIKSQFQSPACPMPTRIMLNQTLKRFLASIKSAPERYKAASATQIPFADDRFDIVFSIDTVTAFLDRDRETFLASIKECLRVAKPGGLLKFLPFQDRQPVWSQEVNDLRMRNDDEVLNWLKNHPEVEGMEIANTSAKHHHSLAFRKKTPL